MLIKRTHKPWNSRSKRANLRLLGGEIVGWMQEGRKWHFWQNWVFDGIWKYRFIRTFCTIFKVLSPFIFQNIKHNVFKICHLRPYCTNIWQMCLMQEGRKCHLRPSCTNFRQMCVMQERHKCHLRPSCIKQLISLNSPCFGFTPTVHTKNSFKWNIKTN